MRKIVKTPIEQNIACINDIKFDPKKIYIAKISGKYTKLSLLDNERGYPTSWGFVELNGSYDYWTGNSTGDCEDPMYLLKCYSSSSYELYEFNNIFEFAEWLYSVTRKE